MRYVARQPDPDVNTSREHPLAEASTLLLWLSGVVAVVVVVLIFLVDAVLYFVPARQEAAMFDAWLPTDIVTVAYDDDRLLKTDAIVQRLARHYPESPYTFRIEIDDSPEPNAMAFPGGLIVVTSGLLRTVPVEIAHQQRPRPDQAHVAAQDVPATGPRSPT